MEEQDSYGCPKRPNVSRIFVMLRKMHFHFGLPERALLELVTAMVVVTAIQLVYSLMYPEALDSLETGVPGPVADIHYRILY
jgi:hypothetical protein